MPRDRALAFRRLASALALALAAAAFARADEDPIVCPTGTRRVSTDNPYQPFRCIAPGEEPKKGFDAVVGVQGFKTRPRCPRGTRPVEEAGNSLQPYRCVSAASAAPDSELTPIVAAENLGSGTAAGAGADPLARGCPKGQRKTRTTDPLEPYRCVDASPRPRAGSFARFAIPRAISFDYPAAFRVQDAWKEDVPTLYLKLDDGAAGKPVTITITLYDSGQSTYQEISQAIAHDVEWLGAKDGGALTVAGARARVTVVPSDTRSVYLPASKQSYYSFVYSAPADAFDAYLPAFSRLLKTLKLGGGAR